MSKYTYKNLIFVLAFIVLFFGAQSASASDITPESVVELTNNERAKEGIGALKINDELSQAAKMKLQDMIDNDYFSHESPQGTSPWHWIEKSGYDYKYAGENLAINFLTAEDQHKAWMESSKHKKNILNSNFQEIGVAVKKAKLDDKMTFITVQMFGTSSASIIGISEVKGISKTEKNSLAGEEPEMLRMALSDLETNQGQKSIPKNSSNISNENYFSQSASMIILAVFAFDSGAFAYGAFKLVSLRRKNKIFVLKDPSMEKTEGYIDFLEGLSGSGKIV